MVIHGNVIGKGIVKIDEGATVVFDGTVGRDITMEYGDPNEQSTSQPMQSVSKGMSALSAPSTIDDSHHIVVENPYWIAASPANEFQFQLLDTNSGDHQWGSIGDTITIKNANDDAGSAILFANMGYSNAEATLQIGMNSAGAKNDAAKAFLIASLPIKGSEAQRLLNQDYLKPSLSANGKDTVLTLTQGSSNNATYGALAPIVQAVNAQNVGVTGADVTVGIISNGFGTTQDRGRAYAAGALGGVDIVNPLLGYEGLAMAEIVHAIAPGANIIYLNTSAPTKSTLGDAIRSLDELGCQIIVDDFDLSSPIGELYSTNAINDAVLKHGKTYVTVAGNYALAGRKVSGHNSDENAITVGAMNWEAAPFVHYLNLAMEPISEQGKVDVTAPDGATTTLDLGSKYFSPFPKPGSYDHRYNPFFGTSGSAPVVAGVAALMMQANPALNPQVRDLRSGNPAIDLKGLLPQSVVSLKGLPGSGWGLIQVDKAVQAARGLVTSWYERPNTMNASPGPVVGSAALSDPSGDVSTGSTLRLTISMTEAVTVSGGTPTFILNDGTTAHYNSSVSSPSAGTLVFDYTVSSNDQTSNLAVTGFNANGATIHDASGNNADFSALFNVLTGVSVNSPLMVTSVTSSQTGEIASGQTIQLTLNMNEPVAVNRAGGAPTLSLSDGAIATYDTTLSSPSSGKLVFDYTVAAGDATPNLSVTEINLPTGTRVQDANGNNADFSAALNQDTGLQIGPAYVYLVTPSQTTNVGAGQTINLTVTMSEAVTVSGGEPTLILSDGANASYDANLSNPSSGSLVFDYTVGANDYSPDLAISGVVNGATVKDAYGVVADFSQASNNLGLEVNAATVSGVAASQTGEVGSGATVMLTLAINKGVMVNTTSGSPTVTLDDEAIATYDANASNPSAGNLVFDYTVGPTDESPDWQVVQVDLNGASINDLNGHAADFSTVTNFSTNLQVGPAFISGLTPSLTGEADTGQALTLTMALSQGVILNPGGGPPSLTLNNGAVASYDPTLSNPSSGSLVFDYMVGANDYVSDLEIASVNLPSGTTVKDSHGVNVDFSAAPEIPTGLQINSSALAANATVSSGRSVVGVTVPNGLSLHVLSGGSASDAFLSGGAEYVNGIDTDLTVSNGGTAYVSSGGTASASTVLAGGVENVLSSGSVNNAVIIGGTVNVSSGGTATDTVISNGGAVYVQGGINGHGGTKATTISNGGTECALSGSLTSNTIVCSGGVQVVSSGGESAYTTVNSGGYEIVSKGGDAFATTINGGTLELKSGGQLDYSAIYFAGAGGTLLLDGGYIPAIGISGFAPGDTIDLVGVNFDSTGSIRFSSLSNLMISENGRSYSLTWYPSPYAAGWRFKLSSDGNGGTDIVLGAQRVDLNRDGISDILFRNDATGDTWFEGMYYNGAFAGWYQIGGSSAAYGLVGTGDFYGTGTPDLLFRNNTTGDTWFEAISNGAFAGWHQIGGSDTHYSVVGVGDFYGRGTDDILFRNSSSGDIWFEAISNGAFAGWHQVGGSDTRYAVVGVGDFYQNGTENILFRNNSTGDTWFAALSNGAFAGWHQVGGSDTRYSVVGVGDFFGNGADDILFRNNSTGDTWFETISGGTFNGWHQVGGSDTNYAVAGIGDYFGNGIDDILFRNNGTGDTWCESLSNGNFTGWHQIGGSSASYTVKT
jgi:autotransporter passenger strand-loop-strand repeat protein